MDNHSLQADFSGCEHIVRTVVQFLLDIPRERRYCLNVNIPNISKEEIKGIKICRQAKAYWDERFVERHDPFGQKYYWLTGDFIYLDEGEETDVWALKNNYVSVVPTQFDLTDYNAITTLKDGKGFI